MDTHTAHALIRFGLGRRGAEDPPHDPQAWLAGQLDGPDPALAVPCHTGTEGLEAIRTFRQTPLPERKPETNPMRAIFRADTAATMDGIVASQAPFRERLAWFWANHFTVSLHAGECAALVHAFLREAIRPHVTGRFADMLLAVMRHPAMLLYLDNAQSTGPNSPLGLKQRRGLNENLARECLELHTLSPAAGYTQADVTEFAKVITGWSIVLQRNPPGFIFRTESHEPGAKTVMGRTYPPGEQGGIQALAWLADHPATHRHLAAKLVRHFVADDPPPALVRRIEGVLRDTHGDLKAASLELIRLPEAWQPLAKLRSPADYVVAVMRALDLPDGNRPAAQNVMATLGQPLFNAPLPNGWPDTAADWSGPEAILRRVDWTYAVSARAGRLDPGAIARDSLGPLLPDATLAQIGRAGSKREAFTLLLASPEFQRR
ncbi:DUF1800 domain-containing protein [Limobrevibacterium gyesilva]|uniref:DUF1800 domain-containing protein n=1 Tax=Limobrevibacterium gyesilva TaxID=2991712 RepID=A0AA41YQ39_9PROT|nr:DUF1800 domain-containing protein [Limobrevibacterium gyesilva]MCW3476805.1 DUF1800 domain-containing protein [Limobrevibacterium gyesilva]